MANRQIYKRGPGDKALPLCNNSDRYKIAIAAPVISEGDLMGCIVFFSEEGNELSNVEFILAKTVSSFISKQMES